MLWIAIAVAVLLPVTEIVILVLTVREAGVLITLGLLLVAGLLGAWLARREGMRAWRATRDALAQDRVPAAEVTEGMIILVGGVLLLLPGFVSDALGILALLPPTRRLMRRLLLSAARNRLPVDVSDTVFGPREVRVRRVTSRRGPGRTPSDPDQSPPKVIEGTVVDDDEGRDKDGDKGGDKPGEQPHSR